MRVWVVTEWGPASTASRRILGVYSARTVAEDIASQEDGRDVETHLVDEPASRCGVPTCPCNDGDPCNYEDYEGTRAMALPKSVPPVEPKSATERDRPCICTTPQVHIIAGVWTCMGCGAIEPSRSV